MCRMNRQTLSDADILKRAAEILLQDINLGNGHYVQNGNIVTDIPTPHGGMTEVVRPLTDDDKDTIEMAKTLRDFARWKDMEETRNTINSLEQQLKSAHFKLDSLSNDELSRKAELAGD